MDNRKTTKKNQTDNQSDETKNEDQTNETAQAGSEAGSQDGTRSDNTEDTSNDEKREQLLATSFSMEGFEGNSFGSIGQFIWDKIPGEKWDDRFDNMQSLITAMRVARDNSKPKSTRENKSVSDIIRESIGKPMSDLQAVKVTLMKGVSLPIPAVIRLADDKNSPMHGFAVKFLDEHKIKAVEEKKGSRGKASKFLRKSDYVVPTEPASEGDQQKAA